MKIASLDLTHSPGGESAFTPSLRLKPSMRTDFMGSSNLQHEFIGATINSGNFSNTPAATGTISKHHPGIWNCTSSATASSGYACVSGLPAILIGGSEVFDICFFTPAVFTTVTARMGFINTTTGSFPSNGAWLSFSTSGAIVGNTASGGTGSGTATITTLAASNWYHGRVTVNALASSVLFEIYSDAGALLGSQTMTLTIPTAIGNECGAGFTAISSGTVSINVLTVDYMSVDYNTVRTRGALTGL